jgi:MFS family permease
VTALSARSDEAGSPVKRLLDATSMGMPTPAERPLVNGSPRGFWIVAAVLGLFLASASAPTPLYAAYAARWHFSPATLTAVFAVYAITLLIALLVFGTLSDAVGRKPVIVGSLVLLAGSLATFVAADGLLWLFAARILQGLATGLTTAAVSAALLELQAPARPTLGALVNATSSTAGLAVGALFSGALVQYGPAPRRLVYLVLLALSVVLLLAVIVRVDETTMTRQRPRMRARPSIPKSLRALFVAALPCITATWALAGLYLSRGPTLARTLEHSTSSLLGGGIVALLTGSGFVAALTTQRVAARRAMLGGCAMLAAGSALTALALLLESPPVFYLSTATAGVGFGTAFLGAFRTLTALAPPADRGGLVSAVYIVAYVSLSVPAVIAGLVAGRVVLRSTAIGYSATVSAVALAALVATARASRVRAGS